MVHRKCFIYLHGILVTLVLLNFRHSTDREVALMIVMAYLSYIMAEVRLLPSFWHLC